MSAGLQTQLKAMTEQPSTCVMPAQAGIQILQNFFPQVAPFRVAFLNQAKFPGAIPFFELLFSGDGRDHIVVHFIIHQAMNPIFFSEAFRHAVFVFPTMFHKIACHSDVERAIALAGESIDAGVFLHDAILSSRFRGNDVNTG